MSETLKSKKVNARLRESLNSSDKIAANEKRKETKLIKYGDENYCNKEGEFTLYECSDDAFEIQKAKMKHAKELGYAYQVYLYKRNKVMEIINEF